MSTTRLQLEQLISEAIGDYLEFDTSTNIGAGVTIISTTLQSYDGGQNDTFNDWWVSFQEGNNIAVAPRQVSDYATASGTLTIRGANLAAEAGAVTVRLHRFNPTNKWRSMNRALEQVYPSLFKRIDDRTLVTGNWLPNAHFQDWASASYPDFYTVTNSTAAATTTAGLTRGGEKSVKVTDTVANGYLNISSNTYPALLDLMGKSVDFEVWAYPEVVDDAWIKIYTLQADGTSQTLQSTSTCPAGKWSLLSLLGQALNNDLVQIDFRFGITTNLKYAHFDDAVVVSADNPRVYTLPTDFQTGIVKAVHVQDTGYATEACYDLAPHYSSYKEPFRIIRRGTYAPNSAPAIFSSIELANQQLNYLRVRLLGVAPLGTMSADTSTIDLEGETLNLIVAKTAAILYKLEQGPVSSEDKGRYAGEINYWEREVSRLKGTYAMVLPSGTIYTGV